MAAILSLPSLKSFSIDFCSWPCPLPAFGRLRDLHKFKFSIYLACCPLDTDVSDISHQLCDIVVNNPGLAHLDLRCTGGPHGFARTLPALHNMLSQSSASAAPPLKIQHLAISSWYTRFDVATMSHFRSLKSLVIWNWTSTKRRNPSWLPLQQIWPAFLVEGIHLTSLHTQEVTAELLSYLGSYSGLRTLQLTLDVEQEDEISLAHDFFDDVLPNHADTIEELHILPMWDGPWCFQLENAQSILKCQMLVHLSLTVTHPSQSVEPRESLVSFVYM
jgi:hypothetical protein